MVLNPVPLIVIDEPGTADLLLSVLIAGCENSSDESRMQKAATNDEKRVFIKCNLSAI